MLGRARRNEYTPDERQRAEAHLHQAITMAGPQRVSVQYLNDHGTWVDAVGTVSIGPQGHLCWHDDFETHPSWPLENTSYRQMMIASHNHTLDLLQNIDTSMLQLVQSTGTTIREGTAFVVDVAANNLREGTSHVVNEATSAIAQGTSEVVNTAVSALAQAHEARNNDLAAIRSTLAADYTESKNELARLRAQLNAAEQALNAREARITAMESQLEAQVRAMTRQSQLNALPRTTPRETPVQGAPSGTQLPQFQSPMSQPTQHVTVVLRDPVTGTIQTKSGSITGTTFLTDDGAVLAWPPRQLTIISLQENTPAVAPSSTFNAYDPNTWEGRIEPILLLTMLKQKLGEDGGLIPPYSPTVMVALRALQAIFESISDWPIPDATKMAITHQITQLRMIGARNKGADTVKLYRKLVTLTDPRDVFAQAELFAMPKNDRGQGRGQRNNFRRGGWGGNFRGPSAPSPQPSQVQPPQPPRTCRKCGKQVPPTISWVQHNAVCL